MPADIKAELKDFERDLAHVVARFLKLYEHIEATARPADAGAPPQRPSPPTREPPSLPGYG